MGRAAKFANQAVRIRLARYGCVNRPFYHIVAAKAYRSRDIKPLDQIGTYDPMPNDHNEKLISINFEKLHVWINKGAFPSKPVEMLLGLAGFYPVHPMCVIHARRNLKLEAEKAKRQEASELEEKQSEEEGEQGTAV